jgi:hypothetical protein
VNGSDDRSSVPAKARIIQIVTTVTSVTWVIRPSMKNIWGQAEIGGKDQKSYDLSSIMSLTLIIRKKR